MASPLTKRICVWLPVLLILSYGGILLSNLSNGVPSHWDEYLTLVRSQSFEQTGDWWAVHINEEPNFKKPPLQYWMTAGLMQLGLDGVIAGRAVSVVFTMGLLGSLLLLVFALFPPDRERRGMAGAMTLALAMLFTSSFILWAGRSCLLDSGMAFFATMTLASLLMTERHWSWWLVAGLVAGLGSLHKSHFTAGLFVMFGLIFLVQALRQRDQDQPLRVPLLAAGSGFIVMIALAAFWPVLQTIRFGEAYLQDAFGKEVAERLAPSETSSPLDRLFELSGWLMQDSGALMCFGLGALLLLPLAKEARANYRVLAMAGFVLCAVAGLAMASGKTYERYVLAFTPVWAGVGAYIWVSIMQEKKFLGAIPVLLLIGASLQLPSLASVYAARDAKFETIRKASEEFGELVEDADQPVVVKSYGVPPSAFLFWSGVNRYTMLLIEERENDKAPEPLEPVDGQTCLRGVSHFSQLPMIRRVFDGRSVEVNSEVGPYIIWTAAPTSGKVTLATP